MIHLSISFLLIWTATRCVSSSISSQTVLIQEYYPPGWQEAPGSIDDFPVGKIGSQTKTIIDPWVYLQRLGIFKLMVQRTQPYFKSWGYNNTGNLLWGLPLQFGWQKTSGRLRDMAGNRDCSDQCVSSNSWWADMNYYLSVLPFLGALNAGLFSPLKHPVYVAKPTNLSDKVKEKFCTSVEECLLKHDDVVRDWTKFFQRVNVTSLESPSVDSDQDTTVALMWKAHTTSIHNALPLFTKEATLLSTPERKFGVGWALLVEFIAATHYQTNLINTAVQQTALPPRVLRSSDKAPFIGDLSTAQNRAILAINLFDSTNTNSKGLLLRVWRRAMCSPKGRDIGRGLMVDIMDDPWIIPRKLFKLLWAMYKYSCN